MLLVAMLPAILLAVANRDAATFFSRSGWPGKPANPAARAPAAEPDPKGGSVTVEAVLGWREPAGVLWLDARPAAAFARDRVPGALPLTEDDWDALLPGVLERWTAGTRVVVYCDGGDCRASELVAARLRDAGLSPVFILAGGWPAWARAASSASPAR